MSPERLRGLMKYLYQVEGELYDVHSVLEDKKIAERAAENYHYKHNGWESRWPLEITVYDKEDPESGETFIVNRDLIPVFSAYKKENQ